MDTYLSLAWSTSRGRDTYGYNICTLTDRATDKRYRTCGEIGHAEPAPPEPVPPEPGAQWPGNPRTLPLTRRWRDDWGIVGFGLRCKRLINEV